MELFKTDIFLTIQLPMYCINNFQFFFGIIKQTFFYVCLAQIPESISNQHKLFFSKNGIFTHSHYFCLNSSFSITLHTLSTSLSEGIISGSIHVRKSLIIVYMPFT